MRPVRCGGRVGASAGDELCGGQDTRFGRASGWRHQLEGLTGRPVLDTLQADLMIADKESLDLAGGISFSGEILFLET